MSIGITGTSLGRGSVPADPVRRLSLIAGIFFLLTFVHIGIFPLYDSILNNPNFILGSGEMNAARLGAVVEVVVIIANVATGVILFQVLRYQQPTVALAYVAIRIFESTVIAIGTICLLAIVTLRESGVAATAGIDSATLVSIGQTLVAIRDWTFFFGPGLCAGFGNGVLLGYLMYGSGLLPRKMALLGLIGGPLSMVGLTFVLFGQWDQDAPAQLLFTLCEIAWELSLSIFLIAKGFNRSPIAERFADELATPAPTALSESAGTN
jgi:hypothetical protein